MKSYQIVIEVEKVVGQIVSSAVPVTSNDQLEKVMKEIEEAMSGESPYLVLVNEDRLGKITRYIPLSILSKSIVYVRVFDP